nr:caspase family protein [uncultured Desulfobacter sp.]
MHNYLFNRYELGRLKKASRSGNQRFRVAHTVLWIALIVSMTFVVSCAAPKRLSLTAAQETDRASAHARMVVQLTHANHVSAMDVSADGHFLVSAGWDNTVRLWNARTGQEIRRFAGHIEVVRSVALSPDGALLLTGSADQTARLWDTFSGRELMQLKGHTQPVTTVAFSPDASWFATGSEDMTVRLWNAEDGREIRLIKDFNAEVTSLAISPDGRRILTGGGITAQLWNPKTGREIRRFIGHQGGISAVAISPDGRFALTGSLDKTARLWNITNGREIQQYTGHEKALTSAAFCHDGHVVVTGSQDATARLWNALQGTQYGNAIVHSNAVTVVDTFAEETVFFTAAGEIPQAWSLDLSSGTVQNLLSFEGNSDWVSSVDFSPDGKRLLIGTWDDTAQLWDAGSGVQLHRLQGHTGDVRGVTFSPDGQWIATAARDGTARIWQTNNGLEFYRLTGHNGGIRPVVFSGDGRWILTGGDDGTARVWDRQTGFSQVSLLGPHEGRVSSVAFSPDGRRVVTASKQMVRLWDVATQRIIRHFKGHTRLVNTVTFSPDGRRILSAGWDQVIQLWDSRSGTKILNFEGHTNGIHSAVFSRDGRYVATGSEDRTIRLWDSDSGKELRRFIGHTSAVIQVAFSPDNRFLLSASADQTARLWDTATGEELCQLISFRDGGWAVVDRTGRFDASNGGDVEGLHWVVGLEAIALSQLKERYYDPGLLAKKMGYNREPLRTVASFVAPGLFPSVITKPLDPKDPRLQITLVNRGGGLGRAVILLNGKEMVTDARGGTVDPSAERADLPSIPLAGHPYLLAGQKNVIEIRTYNAEGYLSSRGITMVYQEPGTAEEEKPVLWAIVAGVSDYAGNAIDLRYAAKDAEDMAHALEIGATRLFGVDNVRLTLLITSDKSEQATPTRERLQAAFEAAAKARASDLLIVYLAGHGVNYGGQDGDFYYLTPDAGSGNLDDPAVRASAAISSRELTEMIKKVPALKQILILDTCAAGRVVERLTEKRDIASSQVRSLERMKDRTGLYVLAGSAADAVSYEASQYGQGLLTWSLLFGMRGAALRESQFVDVERLLHHAADHVPQIAKDIGGIQRPVVAMPRGGASFDFGQLLKEDRQKIRLATVRPLILQSSFQDEQRFLDHLKLSRRVNDALREVSVRGQDTGFVYVDAADFPDAYSLAGRYWVYGNLVKVRALLFKEDIQKGLIEVAGDITRLNRLAADIITEIERTLEALPG